jgi:AraC-like DNA-binding protein
MDPHGSHDCLLSFLPLLVFAAAVLTIGQEHCHCRQLERSEKGLKQVTSTAGFGNVDVMRRAFVRLWGITPGRYRQVADHSTTE